MAFSLSIAYHRFNHFLGTLQGDLLKKGIEFVLVTIILYMLISEYRKDKNRELKFLIAGFSLLWVEKVVMTIILSQILLVDEANAVIIKYTPVVTNILEITGLLLITIILLSEVYKKRTFIYAKKGLLWCATAFVVLQILWVLRLAFFPKGTQLIFGLLILFELSKIAVLTFPVYYLYKKKKLNKYYKKLALAFGVYAISPLIHLVNIILFAGVNKYLKVIAHPFPFIAMLLFLRIIFIKLADKALITKELKMTKAQYEEAKQISEMKDEFISTVNHELRTPLTSLKLYVSLMLQGKMGKVNEEQEKALVIMDKESSRLGELISDILDLSKFESGKAKLKIKKHNLPVLLDHGPYDEAIKEKKITLTNKVPKEFPVKVDGPRFKQVFVNLLSNALKYSEEGGAITLGATQSSNTWQFWMQDTGLGIEKEDQKKIFEKFYQVEHYLTRQKGGTGLGLPITKKIVEMHNGTINVESTPGKGSTFTVEFPV